MLVQKFTYNNKPKKMEIVKKPLSIFRYEYERLSLILNIYHKSIHDLLDKMALGVVYDTFFDFWGSRKPEIGNTIRVFIYIIF